ncbi:hypothetical protein ZHAS_00020639 [Anopheles sinensis]|uniref:Uncharacterized protein n=1 Tax=Anopheles sinensis TaxID=74873 RepID=A0A084WQB6_ANOSI|nr:hypothetical protein ZHAS_00020639 [Anopheles sinensis]
MPIFQPKKPFALRDGTPNGTECEFNVLDKTTHAHASQHTSRVLQHLMGAHCAVGRWNAGSTRNEQGK